MITIILAVALLVALAGLGVEIGVASWNIRRANRYQRKESAAEHTAEQAVSERQDMAKRLDPLDEYVSKVSWLLNFLYARYNKFADLEVEVQEGLNGVTGATPIGDSDARFKDLEKALNLIDVTVKASERMENLMNPIGDVLESSWNADPLLPECSESDKPAEGKLEESPEPKAFEAETPVF
jgi:hypothetical protein